MAGFEACVWVLEKAAAGIPPDGAAPRCRLSRWAWSRSDGLPRLRELEEGCPALEARGAFCAAEERAREYSCNLGFMEDV